MEEMKLTDEEIVQVLECCIKEEHKDCPQCGEFVSQFDCMRNVISNALDLIHSLQADNIQLKWNYVDLKERYVKVLDLNEKVIAKQNAEIERLKTELSESRSIINTAHYKYHDYKDYQSFEIERLQKENAELQKQVDELTEERNKII